MYRQLGEGTLDSHMWGAMGGVIQTGMVPEREDPHPYLQPYTVALHPSPGSTLHQTVPQQCCTPLLQQCKLSPLLFCPPQLPLTTSNYP